jgi:2-iminobutanoate/2-iminopropanoate deaminase
VQRLGHALQDLRSEAACTPDGLIPARLAIYSALEAPWPMRHGAATQRGVLMSRQIIFTPKAARPPATYSQAVRAAGLIFVSGTAPHDPHTGALVGSTVQEQTRQCLTNIAAILEAAGSSLDKIASVTVILAEEEDFQGMNEEWLKWFPANPPARQGARLPVRIPGLRVSIAAVAEA